MKLHRSGEDYLKTILILRNENGTVRSTDVAEHLGVSKACVSRAMKLLCEGGFLMMGEHKRLHLTELGASVAEQDACRIEHVISRETLERVKSLCTQRSVEMLAAQPIIA